MKDKTRKVRSILAAASVAVFVLFKATFVQGETIFTDLTAEHEFSEWISFNARIDSSQDVESVALTFKPQADGRSIVVQSQIEGDSRITTRYEIKSNDYLPPFSTIDFWFTAQLEDGSQVESETSSFFYVDNRYDWNSLTENGPYKIFWANGSRSLGQAAADSIEENFDTYDQYINLPKPDSLRVYIYPTASALQSALGFTSARWIAGHADPAANNILVSVQSGFDEELEIKRQVPHELIHIRLYLYMQESYLNLPVWYSEGLASLGERFTSTEYWSILQAGWENDQLIPMQELCKSFPSDTGDAALAYAQADSFIHYLYDTYGRIGLQDLLNAYKDGHTCENGASIAFDLELTALEQNWKQATFRRTFFSQGTNPVFAWVLLSILLLITPVTYVTIMLIRSNRRSQNG
ncbi:MAG: peptidase MA family metallohydrolase [Anaerolineales bacterium]|jgi:hypothetical protein